MEEENTARDATLEARLEAAAPPGAALSVPPPILGEGTNASLVKSFVSSSAELLAAPAGASDEGAGGAAAASSAASCVSASCASASVEQNGGLRRVLHLLEPLLDVEGILLMRQTCRLARRHLYRPAGGVLSFAMFRGVDARVLMEQVVPLACQAVHPELRESGLSLDFSGCTLLRDASVARLMDLVHSGKEDNRVRGTLRRLSLDFCYELTNKGLAAMLTTYLPSLESLSLRCARSNELTFSNLAADFSPENWPRLTHVDVSFTNMRLEAATLLADALVANAAAFNKRHRRDYETKLLEEKQLRALLAEQEKEREQHALQALQLREDAEAVRVRLAEQRQLLSQKELAVEARREEAGLGDEAAAIAEGRDGEQLGAASSESPAAAASSCEAAAAALAAASQASTAATASAPSSATEKKSTREESALEELRAAEAAVSKQRELVVRLEQQLESLLTAADAAEGAALACQTASDHSKAAAEAAAVAAQESLALAAVQEQSPVTPSLEMLGSLASMCLLVKVGMEAHCRSFSHMVKLGQHEKISSLTKVVQKEVRAALC